jgi:hypothetical protein
VEIDVVGNGRNGYDATMDKESLPESLGRRIGNMADLPEELRKQLQVAKVDDLHVQVIDSLEQLDGVANLDEVLVALYRASGKVYNRAYLSNKMYRMAQAGAIESVPKKKGVYRLPVR